MDYEDFVEGIKPNTDGGTVTYDVEDGIFKLLSDKAKENYENSLKTIEVINIEQQTKDLFEKYCFKIENELSTNESVELYSKSKMHIRKVNRKKDGSAYSLQLAKDATSSPQGLKVDIVVRDFHDFKEGKIKSASDVKPSYDSQSSSHGNAIYYFELYKRLAEFEKTQKQETVTQKTELQNYVLIIDEINRGNVSKIFGELITLLEADKRIGGEHPIKVTLPYSKEEFGVPSNLYIIGTMNTTDRSVGNIDYAVRRRFAFVTLESKREIVAEKCGEDSKAVQLFDVVKEFLQSHKSDMDFEDLMVGHSYFMADNNDDLQLKLDYEIVPLIREYYKDGIINVSKKDLDDAISNWNAILKS
ncbi:MAG: AAA family ATPase [Bacteroidales bacterium]|nr:AAA family ATPase [Bacteroidales bacterium]